MERLMLINDGDCVSIAAYLNVVKCACVPTRSWILAPLFRQGVLTSVHYCHEWSVMGGRRQFGLHILKSYKLSMFLTLFQTSKPSCLPDGSMEGYHMLKQS